MYELVMKGVMIVPIILGVLIIIAPKAMGAKPLKETQKGRMIIRLFGAGLAVVGLLGLWAIETWGTF